MDYIEYTYKNGTVGLYTIDGFHRSVILNFPEGSHEEVETHYNKLLEKMGKLRTIDLG